MLPFDYLWLVDQLGGLDRAVAYAQRNYTNSGHAKVSVWKPPTPSLMNKIRAAVKNSALTFWPMASHSTLSQRGGLDVMRSTDFLFGSMALPIAASGVMLTVDDTSAVECLLENGENHDILTALEPSIYIDL